MKIWRPSGSSLFPYTTLFRSAWAWGAGSLGVGLDVGEEQGKTVHLRHERDRASGAAPAAQPYQVPVLGMATGDRKSTRLNSSHVAISYAVFCLKKKINILRFM